MAAEHTAKSRALLGPNALIARGTADDIAHRVTAHFDAGADHVSPYVLTADPATPPIRQWQELAARLLA